MDNVKYFFWRIGAKCIYFGPVDIFHRSYNQYLDDYDREMVEMIKEEQK